MALEWETYTVYVAASAFTSVGTTHSASIRCTTASYGLPVPDSCRPWVVTSVLGVGATYIDLKVPNSSGQTIAGKLPPEATGIDRCMGPDWDAYLGIVQVADTVGDVFIGFSRKRKE